MTISFGGIASNIACSLEDILPLAMALSMVFGLFLGLHTIYTYKNRTEFKQNGQDWHAWSSLTSAIIKFSIAVMFVYLPGYIAVAAETLTVADGQQLSDQFCIASKVINENDKSIGGIAKNITNSLKDFSNLAEAIAYLSGFFIAMGSLFKFISYRDNPQQTPIGTPITWLAISVFLIFLPELLGSGAQTIWGAEEVTTVNPWDY